MNECYQENKQHCHVAKKNSPQVEEEAPPEKVDKNEGKECHQQ